MKIFPYQKDGIDLITNKYKDVLLADHPGAGKTAQAIISCDELNAEKILVICPASLRENWKREFKKWSSLERKIHCVYGNDEFDRNGVVIISYDLAAKYYIGIDWQIDVLIIDETHYLKNRKSKRTKIILNNIWPLAKKRICITGTPLPNGRAIEAYPLFSKLAPQLFGNFWDFVRTYCIKEITRWGTSYNKSKNLEMLGKLARNNFMIRRKREETIGQLPPLIRMQIPLSGASYLKFHNWDSENEILESVESNSLKFATLRRELGLLKIRPAFEYICEQLKSIKNCVVFTHHREVIIELQNLFDESEISYSLIRGDTPPIQRQIAIDAFQNNKTRVFLASILAANTGITLTASSDIIFVEYDWVPENNYQAESRCHRIGQTEITKSHYLYIPDSIDDKITIAVLKKLKDIEKVMGETEINVIH